MASEDQKITVGSELLRTYQRDFASMFRIEAGQKETIERDHVSIYQLLFGRAAARLESPTVEEAAIMAKN